MTQTALLPDEVTGWRAEIGDGQVVDREGSAGEAESEPDSQRRGGRRTRSSSQGTRTRKTSSTRSRRRTT